MRLIPFTVAFVLLAVNARLAEAARFEARRLSVDGDIIGLVPADLDGDGRLDLVAAYRTGVPPRQKRFFGLFWNRGRSFSLGPDEVIPVGESAACAFDVADVDEQPGAEILIVTPRGVEARSFPGRRVGAPTKLLETATIFYQPPEGELPRLALAQEVGTPGRKDLLVPTLGGLELHKRTPAGYSRVARLDVTMDARGRTYGRGRHRAAGGAVGPIQVTYAFPVLTVVDTDGDGRKDIVASMDDRLAIYRQEPGLALMENRATCGTSRSVRPPS